MDYTFQFGAVLDELPYLLGGAAVTLQIAFVSFWGGALIGLVGALAKEYGGRVSRRRVPARRPANRPQPP